MTQFKMELSASSKAHLKRLEKSTPRTFAYALRGTVKRAKNRFASAVVKLGGKYGVPKIPPHDPFTVAMRANKGPVFGKFGSKSMIFAYPLNGGWTVGWPDRVAEWMSANQGAQTYPFNDNKQRHYFHRRLGALGHRDYPVPPSYVRPSRLVAEPFGREAPNWFPQMLVETYEKKAAKILSAGKEVM